MGLNYQAVGWNPQKKTYDRMIALGVVLYLASFVGVGALWFPEARAETLMIRAFGTCAFMMLHIVLAIGPLCRLDRRFLPLARPDPDPVRVHPEHPLRLGLQPLALPPGMVRMDAAAAPYSILVMRSHQKIMSTRYSSCALGSSIIA